MTILILNASSRTSRFVLRALLAPDQPPSQKPHLRLHARSQASIDSLKSEFPQFSSDATISAVDYVVADSLDPVRMKRAMDGVEVVWYNGPAWVSQATAMGIAMVDAAMKSGVKHVVLCTVLHPFLTKLINHIEKLPIEEYLVESGLPYTILQPTSFMQNLSLSAALSTGKLTCTFTPTVLQGFLDLEDFAAVARTVLLNPAAHIFARYELVGQNCALQDIARQLSKAAGKEIECVQPPRDITVEKFAKEKGLTALAEKDGFERMLFYYDKRGIPGSSNILRWLLGREPATWEELIAREVW